MADSGRTLRTATLIGISGKQYAGKDFLADMLLKQLPGFTKIPLALAIKQVYAQQQGLSVDEVEQHKAQHRPGLIALGDWGRQQSPNYWLRQALAAPGKKIISDVRLKHEHDFLRNQGAYLIRLEADRDIRGHRGSLVSEQDLTETQLDTVTDWDAVLTNNGDPTALATQLQKLLDQDF